MAQLTECIRLSGNPFGLAIHGFRPTRRHQLKIVMFAAAVNNFIRHSHSFVLFVVFVVSQKFVVAASFCCMRVKMNTFKITDAHAYCMLMKKKKDYKKVRQVALFRLWHATNNVTRMHLRLSLVAALRSHNCK